MTIQHFATKDGASLGFEVLEPPQGRLQNSRPIIFINGMSAVLEDWVPLSTTLAQTRRVVIFDHRGIGHSQNPDDDSLSIQKMAEDVRDLIDHLGMKEVDVLGFSMGGMVAQQLLLLPGPLPFIVQHLILSGSMLKNPHSDFAKLAASGDSPFKPSGGGGPLSDLDKRKLVEKFMRLQFDDVWLEEVANRKKMLERVEISVSTRRPAKQIMKQILAMAKCDLRQPHDARPIPSTTRVLIIHGAKDRMVWPSETDYLTQAIPHGVKATGPLSITRLAGTTTRGRNEFGHFWYLYGEIEEWTGGVLSPFLDDVDIQKKGKL